MTTLFSRLVPRDPAAVAVAAAWTLLAAGVSACDVKVGEGGGLSVDIASGKASDEWVRTYDVAAGGLVEVVNVNGPIEARPSPDGRLEIRAARSASGGSEERARAVLASLTMESAVQPDRVAIEAKAPDDGDAGRPARLSVRYRLLVPKGVRVTLRTENGGVTVDGLDGAVVASATNGGITGRQLSGAVEGTTVNGGVRVDLAAVSGEVRLSAVNGGVFLEVPPTAAASVEATAVNGGVTIDQRLSGASVRRDESSAGPTKQLSVPLNGGGPRVNLQTTNGGVRVVVRGQGPPRS
jgi:hypothetical protein